MHRRWLKYFRFGGKSSSKAGQPLVIGLGNLDRRSKVQMGGLMGKGRPVDLGVTAIVKVKNIFIWLISANISAIIDPFEQFGTGIWTLI